MGDYILVGVDISNLLKDMCKDLLEVNKYMSVEEKRGYERGIQNAIDILSQSIDDIVEDKCYRGNNVFLVHIPEFEGIEDFTCVEDMLEETGNLEVEIFGESNSDIF